MKKPRFDIVAVGDCKADHFLQLPASPANRDEPAARARTAKIGGREYLLLPMGQKVPVDKFRFFAGGNALNAAVTFARLGLATAVAAPLGKDAEAERILECLRKERISGTYIARIAGDSTPQTVILVSAGERVILGYGWQGRYSIPERFRAAWVYLTSLGQAFRPVYRKIAKAKRSGGFRLAYNPGTRQLLTALPEVKRMIGFSEILFVNLEEAQRILGSAARGYKALLQGLLALGCGTAVVTDGPRGAACADFKQAFYLPAFPARRVDATGAGDAFASAFTAAVIRGQTLPEALRWGSINAAGEISQIGVQSGLLKKNRLFAKVSRARSFKPRQL